MSPQQDRPAIAVVALAAGASRRFGGSDKLLAEIDGERLIVRSVKSLARAEVALARIDLVVVVPDSRGPVAAAVEAVVPGVRLVANPRRDVGIGTSVAAGIACLVGDAGESAYCGALVTPCDMPLLDTPLIEALLSTFLAHGATRPVHATLPDGTPVSPMVWPRRLFPALMALDQDRGGRHLLYGEASVAIGVDPATVSDIDTPGDLEHLRFHSRDTV